jgi:hypothetical protein
MSYNLKKYNYSAGIFDNSIDATYIIYLEGNTKRYKNIINGIQNIKPTKTIYILFNKGWKKAKKSSYITNTAKDLVDCNINIFRHANNKGYKNILILEDDFMFDDKLKERDIQQNINNFLINNIKNSFSFYLGTIPFIFMPYNFNINKGLLNIYTHSVIYSQKYRKSVLNYNYKNIFCWDMFQNYFNMNKYYYNIPLAYQIIEETENSHNWPVFEFVRYLYFKLIYLFKADENPVLFFNFVYIFSYFIILLILIIIIKILHLIRKKNLF